MTTETPFISVVIPAHNEENHIARCLNSILSQDYPNDRYEVIVVNNNSTDATVNIVEAHGVHVIDEPTGPVGKVRNTGAKLAKGDILMFLDGDCIAPDGWISFASNRLLSDSNLVLGGGYELRTSPNSIEKFWLLQGRNGASLPKDLLGGSIAVRKSDFFRAGAFDETITSGEDSKLSETLRGQGFDISIEREMSVIHLGNPTTLKAFLHRQIWHSENYIRELEKSISDPTFLLCLAFSALIIGIPISLIFHPSSTPMIAFGATIIPAFFSIKRIKRSRNWRNIKNFPKIYLLDTLYVIGRSLGLFKGIKEKTRSRAN